MPCLYQGGEGWDYRGFANVTWRTAVRHSAMPNADPRLTTVGPATASKKSPKSYSYKWVPSWLNRFFPRLNRVPYSSPPAFVIRLIFDYSDDPATFPTHNFCNKIPSPDVSHEKERIQSGFLWSVFKHFQMYMLCFYSKCLLASVHICKA